MMAEELLEKLDLTRASFDQNNPLDQLASLADQVRLIEEHNKHRMRRAEIEFAYALIKRLNAEYSGTVNSHFTMHPAENKFLVIVAERFVKRTANKLKTKALILDRRRKAQW